MNLHEVDFRYDPISLTLRALKTGLESIREKADKNAWFDGLWQPGHIGNILGIAFVAARAYTLGTVADVNKIRESNGEGEKGKIELLRGLNAVTPPRPHDSFNQTALGPPPDFDYETANDECGEFSFAAFIVRHSALIN